ncbi:uncharacterized protein A1O5_02222 [Cladophialophora psammophila CBS 110553]|uniref:Acyltransferase 3 domain-containing protein n=1 Tax=Cladophialophora psammophila CBS 110553 TaxID=1182543 RepID=W9X185_9EURO|nr:uncharacterized protein A1O5_02222 [Cladophialophora psammophila CBS 110553]EXJ73928.1 hypothetical protein A1O5_02222 [Cladophialophora psammophila CBS 110553]
MTVMMDRANRALHRFASFRLPPDVKERAMKDTGWADGLRGIAAVFVVSSHVVICYARALVPPCCAFSSDEPYLFQRPIFRLVASGHSWVAIFFILMGFVNALKPIQLARTDQVDKALQKLASSSFSRIFRLVLPATTATIISWFLCNLDLYSISAQSNAYWLYTNTPEPSSSWLEALLDLFHGLRATWTYGDENIYDQPQWALVYLLQGSVMIISALSLVVTMTPTWRTVTLIFLAYWSLNWSRMIGDPWAGLCCFVGIALSELSLSDIPKFLAPYSPYISPPITLVSLVFMSYPGSYAEAASWSTWLRDFATQYFPTEATAAIERMYGSLGGILLIVGILISPHARWTLSRPLLLWLGKISFAIYLIHGMFLRTVFAWALHLGHSKQIMTEHTPSGEEYNVERYPLPGYFQRAVATVIMGACVGVASHFWNLKLEPLFAKITARLEGIVTGNVEPEPKSNGNTILPLRKD